MPRIADYRKSNEHFRFHNENPKGKLQAQAQDCVIRALGYANDGYDNAYKDLCDIGFEIKDTFDSNECMELYLKRKGWTKQKQPKKSNGKKYTLEEFCKLHKDDMIVVRMAGHISVIDKGYIIDTWDCGGYCVGNYWTK